MIANAQKGYRKYELQFVAHIFRYTERSRNVVQLFPLTSVFFFFIIDIVLDLCK